MEAIIENVLDQLTTIGLVIVVICIVWLGIRVATKSAGSSGGGMREALSGVGGVLLGCALIGGAAIIAGAFIDVGGAF